LRRLLPLHVDQLDLKEQKHTNTLVLEYLLQPVNSIELMPSVAQGGHLSDTEHLLCTAMCLQHLVQVVLDVGAQILEPDILGVAMAWLKRSNLKVEAAVFVNDTDELCVVYRKDRMDLLQIYPLVARLDVCLIPLDERHNKRH
jgi:hypothetical protein